MQIHLVLGPILSGKTTFINERFNTNEHVIVRIGKFLRESIGLEAMAKDPRPNVCEVTESWVRLHVQGAIRCSKALGRPVVFDGYPRSVEQVDFLADYLNPIMATAGPDEEWCVHVHQLVVGRVELERRIGERAAGNEEAAAFDRLRLDSSLDGVDKVGDQIIRRFKNITRTHIHKG